MKTENIALILLCSGIALHVALANDLIPEELRPLAKKLEIEEVTAFFKLATKGFLG